MEAERYKQSYTHYPVRLISKLVLMDDYTCVSASLPHIDISPPPCPASIVMCLANHYPLLCRHCEQSAINQTVSVCECVVL